MGVKNVTYEADYYLSEQELALIVEWTTKFCPGSIVASSPGPSQILSRSHGEK